MAIKKAYACGLRRFVISPVLIAAKEEISFCFSFT
jgi:hypothetical protein